MPGDGPERYPPFRANAAGRGTSRAGRLPAAAIRIMPLGDSITGSPGGWRALLWNRLQSTGYTDIDFVGTLPPQGCSVAHDCDNEGHGGPRRSSARSPRW